MNLADDLTRLTGTVIELHPKSGPSWSRFRLEKLEGDLYWCTAKWGVSVGDVIDVEANYNSKFKSYDVVRNIESTNVSNEVVCLQLVKYLPGVGVKKAKILSEKFPELYKEITENPTAIADAVNVNVVDVIQVAESLEASQQHYTRVTTLVNQGYPQHLASRIAPVERLYVVAAKCPYSAIKLVSGLGWKIADEIGIKKGIDPRDPNRIKAAINHYYTEQVTGSGHTTVSLGELIDPQAVPALLGCCPTNLDEYFAQELIEHIPGHYTSRSHRENAETIAFFVEKCGGGLAS